MPNVAQTYDASNLRNHTTSTATGLVIVQDTNTGPKAVYRHPNPNSAGLTRGHMTFIVAPNYLTGPVTVRIQYRMDAGTSGSLGFNIGYTIKSAATTWNGGSFVSLSPSSGLTIPGTAGNIGELVINITSGFSPGTMYLVTFCTNRATTDTALNNLDILSFTVEYAADPTNTKQYGYLPASTWQNVAGSPATLGPPNAALDGGVNLFPYIFQFPDSAGNAIGNKFTLPSTYTGNLKYYIVGGATLSGNMTLGLSMGEAAVGSSYDPVLTPDPKSYTLGSVTMIGNQTGTAAVGQTAPISPSAGSTLSLQAVRDSTDASTGIFNFAGLILEYDVFTASPSPVIQFNPTSLAPPISNAASLLAINDTHNSGYIVRFTQGVDQKIAGKRQNPGIYSSGGTFVGFVKANIGSGTLKFHLEFSNPAIGSASDPTPTVSGTVSVNITGANQVLRFTIDVSPGLVASDLVDCMIVREGSTDSVAADADYINGQMEIGVLP